LNQTVSASGNIIAGTTLVSNNSIGDEGGEILLAKPQTNTTLTGSGVTIDIFQNKLRFFEQGGDARGFFVDMTAGAASAGTNLQAASSAVSTYTNATDNRVITSTGVGGINAEANLTFDGTVLSISTNNAKFLQGGDDSALHDINVANTLGVYGVQDSTVGAIKLGSSGQVIYSNATGVGIGTITPGALLHVQGNVSASSFTGSLFGTSSWANNATSASFATSASWAPGGTTFPYIGNADITGSLRVTGSRILILSGSITSSGPANGINVNDRLVIRDDLGGSIIYNTIGNLSRFRVNNANGFYHDGAALSPESNGNLSLGQDGFRWRNLFTTGSIIHTGSVNILSGSINVTNGGITGSLLGTSSFAQTASYFDGFITFPSGLDITGSLVVTGSQTVIGNQTITGSLILSSSALVELRVIGDTEITGSLRLATGGITGSLFGTSSWASNAVSSSFATSASFAPTILPAGVVSSSLQINTGSFSGSFVGEFIGTSSWASNAVTASAATSITFTPTTASYAQTSSVAISSSFATSASWAPSVGGNSFGTISVAGQSDVVADQANDTLTLVAGTNVTITTDASTDAITINASGTGAAFPFSGSAVITGSLLISSSGLILSGADASQVLRVTNGSIIGGMYASNAAGSFRVGSFNTGDFGVILADSQRYTMNLVGLFANDSDSRSLGTSIFRWTSVFTNHVSASGGIAANSVLVSGSNATLQVSGAASIRDNFTVNGGTLSVDAPTNRTTISGSLAVTGSTTIVGAFQATTKSFRIDHQRLPGKSLIYGVLEGAEHAVYARGRTTSTFTGTAFIQLPEEWEWLVDASSITVQLTPIGGPQEVYVDKIENNMITIKSRSAIDCFYLVHATRKDVPNLITVE
jgi:hypothetical protein